jgi:glyoxylase-like metal-dependent hydrolase (beta-lactamase superfamily II)
MASGAATAAPSQVADGVHRLGTKWANFYVVWQDDEATVIDAGYPGYWDLLARALSALGRAPNAIRGVIVTHHHIDHVGTAEAVRSRTGARVWAHPADAPMITGQQRSHVPPGFYRQSWRPSMVRYLAHTVRVGGASYRPVSEVQTLVDGQQIDLPGRPNVIHTPGHTAGHCSVLIRERGVLFAGDALVNFDYASGKQGLRQHRFNDDRERALASLDRLAPLNADVVLFGHGDPFRGDPAHAVEMASAGSSRQTA